MGKRGLRSWGNDLEGARVQLNFQHRTLTRAGVLGQERAVYGRTYQDVLIFKRWHDHKIRRNELSKSAKDYTIYQSCGIVDLERAKCSTDFSPTALRPVDYRIRQDVDTGFNVSGRNMTV